MQVEKKGGVEDQGSHNTRCQQPERLEYCMCVTCVTAGASQREGSAEKSCGHWDDWDGGAGKWKTLNGVRIGWNCVGPGMTLEH